MVEVFKTHSALTRARGKLADGSTVPPLLARVTPLRHCQQFVICHYAGKVHSPLEIVLSAQVTYDVVGWLVKNNDQLNPRVVELLKMSSNRIMAYLWGGSSVVLFRFHPSLS